MNAWTASSIVALIGAIAFVAVAVITAQARIGLLPAITVRDSFNPIDVPIGLTESAKKFRVLGWMLAGRQDGQTMGVSYYFRFRRYSGHGRT